MPNMEKLDAVMAIVEGHYQANDGLWDQSVYGGETECGTAGCLFGHVLMYDGCRFDSATGDYLPPLGHIRRPYDSTLYSDGYVRPQQWVMQSLGLDELSANRLVRGDNTIEDLRFYVEQLRTHGTTFERRS